MLIVTEGARHRLAQMLEEIQATEQTVVRLVLVGANAIVTEPGTTRLGDTSFEYEGRTVLALDEEAGALLEDQILFLDDTEQELELRPQRLSSELREPNQGSSHPSRAGRRHQDTPGVVSDPSATLWVRVRFGEDFDAIYH